VKRLMFALIALLTVVSPARAQEAVEYYHVDALGSVRAVTDQSGVVLVRHDYEPFGREPVVQAGDDSRRFTGKERDVETGLDYFGARYYQNRTGRFTTVDPVLDQDAAAVNPQRWNRYAYGLSNPVRNVDPDGRETVDLAIGFAQGIWNTAKSVATIPYLLATNPGGVASAIADDARLLGYGVTHPGDVIDAYVGLAVSANDADQRALGVAIGEGTAVAALAVITSPAAKGVSSTERIGPKLGSAGGPGAGKRFSRATMGAARAESSDCVFCGGPTTKGRGPTQSNIDHAIPKSKGGNNTLANAQNTCRTCNLRKCARTTEEFVNRQEIK